MNFQASSLLSTTSSLHRCAFLSLPVTLSLLAMSVGSALSTTSFEGKLQNVTITDAAETNTPPTPVFKISQNGKAISVDASGSSDADGSISQYNWEFGDGGKATGATASHQYTSQGSYPITLTVIDNAGGIGISQQQLDLSTIFYWSVDSLPQTTMVSDTGNVTISKYSKDATSAPGVKGKCMQQTGIGQTYKIPMVTVPVANGAIRMYVKHDNETTPKDATYRYFFKSTKTGGANSLYAYTYKGYIFFQLNDSAGTQHRAYGQASWQVNKWHLYEFTWNAATGTLTVQQDGNTILDSKTASWTSSNPSWSEQELFLGFTDPIGSIDEIYITN